MAQCLVDGTDVQGNNGGMSEEEETCPLHKAVFDGDVEAAKTLLKSNDVNQNDMHGNTPLHLAVILGHEDLVKLLLDSGAKVKEKNLSGWTPLDEALSYGNRDTTRLLLKKLREQFAKDLISRRADLISKLSELEDFYAELKWEFHTWVPFLSRLLPSDVCRIYKTGGCIRLDSTLGDFTEMKWSRGDLSFIFNGDDDRNGRALHITVLNNQTKEYQKARLLGGEDLDSTLDDQVDMLMSRPIVYANMSTQPIQVSRAQAGFFFRSDKVEQVGEYSTDVYNVTELILISRKRTEHLTEEDVRKSEEMKERLEKGMISTKDLEEEDEEEQRRSSLTPPSPSHVTWDQYSSAAIGSPPCLGRSWELKVDRKYYKASISVTEQCPIQMTKLLDILEVIVPYKHFHKLRQFVNVKLPQGFPVKLSVPIFPTVTAIVTLERYEQRQSPINQFLVPRDYKKYVQKNEGEDCKE
jgi:hypothetical protein